MPSCFPASAFPPAPVVARFRSSSHRAAPGPAVRTSVSMKLIRAQARLRGSRHCGVCMGARLANTPSRLSTQRATDEAQLGVTALNPPQDTQALRVRRHCALRGGTSLRLPCSLLSQAAPPLLPSSRGSTSSPILHSIPRRSLPFLFPTDPFHLTRATDSHAARSRPRRQTRAPSCRRASACRQR